MSSEPFATRLRRQARPLRPASPPYYRARGVSLREPAPGWYVALEPGRPLYLGHSYEQALRALDKLLAARAALPVAA